MCKHGIMKKVKALVSLFIVMMAVSFSTSAQEKDPVSLQNMIESKNFVFKARTAFPQSGSSQLLTSQYDLTFTGDKLVSFLPFFGRAYSVSPADDGGIKFTSTNFNYTTKKTKKGWSITITPKDANGVQQLFLDISTSGYANLQVNSANRQNISFAGVVERK